MDFHTLPRRDLQTLCKRNKIAANITNVAMADALQALPMVEGLEVIIKDAQPYQSPKKAAEEALPEPASRSCRRTSTRRQTNPPGSSLQRTRRAARGRAGKNEAVVEKEDGAEEDNAQLVTAVGIPNSPTTLSARGRSTRTLITTGGLGAEEEEVEAEKKGEERKVEPLPLEMSKTPATRAKPSAEGGEEAAKKQDEGGAPAVPQTPAASTARRASTRRVTRAAPAPEEASGARSTRYRTRRAAMEDAAETETAAGISTTTTESRKGGGMRRAKVEDAGSPAGDVPVAEEDGAGDGASAAEEEELVVEPMVPVALADDAAAETEQASSADPTAEICLAVPEVDGSDGFQVDQTVEKAKSPDGGVVVEEKGSDGVDQTVREEESGETMLVDPTVNKAIVPPVDPIDRMVKNCQEPVDQTVVEEVAAVDSDDPTVRECSHPVMAVPAAVHQTVEDSHCVHPSDLQGVVEDAPVEGHDDQTAAEEETPEIEEISLDPTVDNEEIPVVGLNDQTVQEAPDLVDLPSEPVLVPVEVEGHVDSTAQEIAIPIVDSCGRFIDPTVEDGEFMTSEGDEAEEAFEELMMLSVEVSHVIADTEAGIQANSQVGGAAAAADSEVPANVELLLQTMEEDDRSGLLEKKSSPVKGREEGEEEAEKEEKAPGMVSIDEILAEGEEEEEAKKEEATGLVLDGPPTETEKAVDLVQAQQPSMAVPPLGNHLSFLFGVQDKENAVIACLGLSGGGGLRQEQQHQVAVVDYDTTTSMRKLKAALKEQLQRQLQAEERKKKRAALTALDDNCILSPKQ